MHKIITLIRYCFLLISITFLTTQNSNAKTLRWKVLNTSWSKDQDLLYQNFIHGLGVARKNGKCRTLNDCLKSPIANPIFYNKNPTALDTIFSDCADLPFVLRAYFSWMNDLPFSYPTELVEAKSLSKKESDIRYSKYGNIITNKDSILGGENVNDVFQNIVDSISTASFRTNASKNDSGEYFRDTYPVDINRQAIIPGTVLYDPNGHVAVVYEVTNNGKIHLIDAHPDNSLTTITYGEKFVRTGVKIGAGFSNFRPFNLIRNEIVPVNNKNLSEYSLIQFQKDPFIYKGQEVSFYEYVRIKLTDGVIIYDPLLEFSNYLDEICQDVKDRKAAVDLAHQAGIENWSHPQLLPENIYGSDGDWETYATPSRDARLKASIRETKEFLTKMIKGQNNPEVKIKYTGADLVKDLRDIYLNKTNSCSISIAQNISLNLDEVLVRLFDLSFDPYHCVELRWGQVPTHACSTTTNKNKWYKAEQGLRNRIDRNYSMRTNYDVDTLPNAPVSNVERPDLSFDQLLEINR
ncbi:MAG: hypothetical protein Q7U04_12895 [Bacteriovorax sp.]|nr:hypothetical protein [Bacteriovorax sp.]